MDVGTARRNGFKVGRPGQGPADRRGRASSESSGCSSSATQGDFGAVSFAAFDPRHRATGVRRRRALRRGERAVQPGASIGEVHAHARTGAEPRGRIGAVRGHVGRGGRGRDARARRRVPHRAQRRAARLRRGRPARRRVHHLQHVHDPRLPADCASSDCCARWARAVPQVVGSVLVEAAVIGVFASAVGLVLGIALAQACCGVLPGFGFPVPAGVASWSSAAPSSPRRSSASASRCSRRSSRRSGRRASAPIAAISDVRTSTGSVAATVAARSSGCWSPRSGVGDRGLRLLGGPRRVNNAVAVTFLGGFVIFLGLVVFGPLIARPLSSAIGRPLRVGVRRHRHARPRQRDAQPAPHVGDGGRARSSVSRSWRSSRSSPTRSRRRCAARSTTCRADFILTAPQFAGFSPQVARAGPRDARGRGRGRVPVGRRPHQRQRRDGQRRRHRRASTTCSTSSSWPGDASGVRRRRHPPLGAARPRATTSGVGDELTIGFPAIGLAPLRVSGIYKTRRFTGAFPIDFIVSQGAVRADASAGTSRTRCVYVKAAPGQAASVGRARERTRWPKAFPNIDVEDRRGYLRTREETVDQFLNVFIALLLLSEIIAVLGIVNTLMLSVYERTREVGLLRTVGTTRRQVWGMVCGESVIIAVIGCVLGLLLGLLWGWGVTNALRRAVRRHVQRAERSARVVPRGVGDRRVSSPRCSPRGMPRASTCSRRSRTSDRQQAGRGDRLRRVDEPVPVAPLRVAR